jgi:hypothetical protein
MITQFRFKDKFYEQLQGTPMGSPISGLLAEVIMQKFENTAFTEIKPRIWIRYVDDTLVILKRHQVESFHEHINSIIPGIKFTIEREADDNTLPFLDIKLHRLADGTIETSVYRKASTT